MSRFTIIAIIVFALFSGGVSLMIGETAGLGWQFVWLGVSIVGGFILGWRLADRDWHNI